jgi:UDPglucose 6-dehydrogenase
MAPQDANPRTPQKLSVIGLGKLGAPMAAIFAAKGFDVVGVDLNPGYVAAINAGRAPVEEPQLQEYIERGRSHLRATQNYSDAVMASEASFIIVPTPSRADRLFTSRYVVDAVEHIGRALRKKEDYHLVVVTSTVMPGSTGGEIRKALEAASGRELGERLGLCYSPEFIALGSVINDMLHPDLTLIGESDERAGAMLDAIYRRTVESRPEVHRMNFVNAEVCKIAINTFVTTKISYANMIGELCDHLPGADAHVVTNALGADTRIGHKYLKPAIGYGGPCFPRDNKAFAALGRKLGVNCALVEATDAINDHQIYRLMGAVEACASPGQSVAVLGLSYKPSTYVIEESQGVALARMLADAGYGVSVFDPQANGSAAGVLGNQVRVAASAQEAVNGAMAVVLTTPWPEFKTLVWNSGLAEEQSRAVIDPWGLVQPAKGVKLVRMGQGEANIMATPRVAVA